MSYGTLICDPRYRRAGHHFRMCFKYFPATNRYKCHHVLFQPGVQRPHLTITNTMITALVGIVNFVASIFGLLFLAFAGRKILMAIFNIAMSITLLLLSYYAFQHNSIPSEWLFACSCSSPSLTFRQAPSFGCTTPKSY